MRWAGALTAVLLLAGCSAAPAAQTVVTPEALHSYYQKRWFTVQDDYPYFIPPTVVAQPGIRDELWMPTVLACVADFDLVGGDRLLFDIAELTCEMEHPSASGREVGSTQEQRDAVYHRYEKVVLPCLRLQGQPVREPPTFKEFSTDYRSTWFISPVVDNSAVRIFQLNHCGLLR